MFARYFAHNNPELFSETSGMMPNFAGVEKFFAHMFRLTNKPAQGNFIRGKLLAKEGRTGRVGADFFDVYG